MCPSDRKVGKVRSRLGGCKPAPALDLPNLPNLPNLFSFARVHTRTHASVRTHTHACAHMRTGLFLVGKVRKVRKSQAAQGSQPSEPVPNLPNVGRFQ